MLPRKVEDLSGRVFNNWRVLSYSHRHEQSRNAFWVVQCGCGAFATVSATRLKTGDSTKCKSCSGRQNGRKGLYAKASGDLYAVRAGDFVKIGVSSTPERRIKDIQSDCPLPVELIYLGVGEAQDESLWHSVFAHRHHKGEWFYMPNT